MGNQLSPQMNESSSIKTLYTMNDNQLSLLRQDITGINPNHVINYQSLVNRMRDIQAKIKNSIPYQKFNRIATFLDEVELDLNTKSGHPLQNSFFKKEQTLKAEFKREQELREKKFYESQKKRRGNYETDITSFNQSGIDGKKLFKLNSNYTMDELKIAYRNLARRFHPDRPDGNNDKFQLITKAYMSLMEELKMKSEDKQFNELKQQSQDYTQEQNNNKKQNIKLKSGRFDPKLFNKIYEDNRLHDVDDDGYGQWINKTKLEEREIEKPKVFSENFNINVFNYIFEKQVKNTHEMIQYREPQAQSLDSFSNSNSMLGIGKVDNYSGMGYTDFREAHSTSRLIDPTQFNNGLKSRSKSIKQLEQERSNITDLTEKELRNVELEKKQKEQEELDRRHYLKEQDKKRFSHFDSLNQQMLKSNLLQKM